MKLPSLDVGRENSHNRVSEEAVYIVSKHRRLLAIAEAVYRAADVHFVVTIVGSSKRPKHTVEEGFKKLA